MNEQILDRELRDVFAGGPRSAPSDTVERALARAAALPQRRPRFARLDRRAWPPVPRTASDPAFGRIVRLIAVAALLALVGAAIAVGARLLDRPPSLVVEPAGTLESAVVAPRAMLWPDGRVLVLGQGGTAILYDPATGEATRHTFGSDFPDPSVDVLPDGRVLLQQGGEFGDDTRSVAWYDAATGQSTSAGSYDARWARSSTLVLRDGRILLSGGFSDPFATPHANMALFDPATGSTTALRPMLHARSGHSLLELEDGRILIAGSFPRSDGEPLESVELYELASQQSKVVGDIGPARGPWHMPPVALPDGRVLIPAAPTVDYPCGTPAPTSGRPGPPGPHTSSREPTFLFDPATDTVAAGPVLPHFYGGANIVALDDGRSLVFGAYVATRAGCTSEDDPFLQAWLGIVDLGRNVVFESYNPMTGRTTLDVVVTREYEAGILLPDGRVMLVGADVDGGAVNLVDLVTIW